MRAREAPRASPSERGWRCEAREAPPSEPVRARWRCERAKRCERARARGLVQRDRRARGARQDLPAQLLVARLHGSIRRALAHAGIVHRDRAVRELGRGRVHDLREGVVEHGDAVWVVARVALVDVARAVIVVRPERVVLVVARHFLRDALAVTILVELRDRLGHDGAAIAVVGEGARAELDVRRGVHEVLPRHALQEGVAVRTAFVRVEVTADRHEAAILREDLAVARVGALGLLVHVALVDHDGQEQRRRELVALGRGRDGVCHAATLGGRPGGGLPPDLLLHGADRVGQTAGGLRRRVGGAGGRARRGRALAGRAFAGRAFADLAFAHLVLAGLALGGRG